VQPPVQLTSWSSFTFVLASVPPNVIVNAVSPSALTVAVAPVGQPAMPRIAVCTPAVVKFVPRKIGAESAPLYHPGARFPRAAQGS